MKLYHCLPREYYLAQLQADGLHPYYGHLWCLDNAEGTVDAQQHHTDDLMIICIDAGKLDYAEEVSDDPEEQAACEENWGKVFVLNSALIPADAITVVKETL